MHTAFRSIYKAHKLLLPSALVFLLALGIRLLSWNSVFSGGAVLFFGYDSYYHMRRVFLALLDFPSISLHDSYMAFPYNPVMKWPVLYDVAIAFVSLIVGMGKPDASAVEFIGALFPAVIGALTAVALIFVGSEIFDDIRVGFVSGLMLAVMPAHVNRSLVGWTDYDAAETLLFVLILLFLLRGLRASRNSSSIGDFVFGITDKGKKETLFGRLNYSGPFWGVLCGFTMACLIFTWLGSLIYIGIVALYIIIQFIFDYIHGSRSDHLLLLGVSAFGSCLLFILPVFLVVEWLPFFYVLSMLGILFITLFFGLLARFMRQSGTKIYIYPIIVIVTIASMWFILDYQMPEFRHGIEYLFGSYEIMSTIGEARAISVEGFYDHVMTYFTAAFYIFAVAFAAYFGRTLFRRGMHSYDILLLIWSLAALILMLMQIRFACFFSLIISIFCGYAFVGLLDLIEFDPGLELFSSKNNSDKKPVDKIKLNKARSRNKKVKKSRKGGSSSRGDRYARHRSDAVLSAGMLVFIALIFFAPCAAQSFSIATGGTHITRDWYDSLEWMRENTPETSFYYEPEEGIPEYGVMSWWDHGNWIVYVAHRPAVADNFQHGAAASSKFLTAQNESESDGIVNRHEVRFVIVDDRTGYGVGDHMPEDFVFSAAARTAGEDPYSYFNSFDVPTPWGYAPVRLLNSKYYNTTYARLYLFDGSDTTTPVNDRVEGLAHYRLVHESGGRSDLMVESVNISNVKIFEFVEGAHIVGSCAPGMEVMASVEILSDQGRTFRYVSTAMSDNGGMFNITVPYPTEDSPYNCSAVGDYDVTCGSASIIVSVSEDDVLGGGIVSAGSLNQGPEIKAAAPRVVRNMTVNGIWTVDVGSDIYVPIAYGDDQVYVSGANGILSAIDADNARINWTYSPRIGILSPPSFGDGYVYVGSGAGVLDSVRSTSGAGVWRDSLSVISSSVENGIRGGASISNGTVYVASNDHRIYAMDTASGRLRWYYELDSEAVSRPLVADDTVYITSYRGGVYAVKQGTQLWSKNLGVDIWSSPAIADGILYVGARDGKIYALDADNGDAVWSYETGYYIDNSPVVVDGILYVGSYDGKVYALNAENGELIWKTDTASPVYVSPVVYNDLVFAGTWNGGLHAIDANSGDILWSDKLGGAVTGMMLDGDRLFVGTSKGIVHGFSVE